MNFLFFMNILNVFNIIIPHKVNEIPKEILLQNYLRVFSNQMLVLVSTPNNTSQFLSFQFLSSSASSPVKLRNFEEDWVLTHVELKVREDSLYLIGVVLQADNNDNLFQEKLFVIHPNMRLRFDLGYSAIRRGRRYLFYKFQIFNTCLFP